MLGLTIFRHYSYFIIRKYILCVCERSTEDMNVKAILPDSQGSPRALVRVNHCTSLLCLWRDQFSSVQSHSHFRLCDLMDCSPPGPSVHHQLPELAQTHVHRVGDAIQPSHPLSSPSPAFSLSQHQGLWREITFQKRTCFFLFFMAEYLLFLCHLWW